MPSVPQSDADFMRVAIRLAMRGRGLVEPNPMVGCVIVKEGRVIGEGWHQKYGGPHAEPNALAACTESPVGATAYVTLEPCCHMGKKTPPCVPKLIEAKLARVVIGCLDPNPSVAGRGIDQLRAAGIELTPNVLEAECKQLAALFFARTAVERPYVTLKWAQTADGKIAGPGGRRAQISNSAATAAVHHLRAACDAVLVGVSTVLTDDPLLTARGTPGARQPARFIVDGDLRIPIDARVVTDRTSPTTVFCAFSRDGAHRRKRDALHDAEVGLIDVPIGPDGKLALPSVLTRIFDAWRYDLLVESGNALADAFLRAGLVDRLWVVHSPDRMNDETAPSSIPVPPEYISTGSVELLGDTLTEYLNPASPVFFAAKPSADYLLAQGAL